VLLAVCSQFTLLQLGFSISDIRFLKALHPGIWGALQLVTGALSDKVGRKILISFIGIIIGMSFLGIETALVYPTLLAAISDIAHPKCRATSFGVYRFWQIIKQTHEESKRLRSQMDSG
jgi:hypothetical protein